jgi:hypothetical protein
MNNMFNRNSEFPRHHKALSASDTVNFANGPVVIYFLTAGTAAVVDNSDVAITYTVAAGDILPVLAKRINSTGTTATFVGLY